MPLYDYKCTVKECNESFETRVPLKEADTAEVKCPKCGKEAKRDISPLRAISSTWRHWRL